MLKIMKELWARNEKLLEGRITELSENDVSGLEYIDLVKMAFGTIFNNKDRTYFYHEADIEHIHEIDDGDYQGTYIYLIPFDTYEPSESDYMMTYVGYGSCSGCDTLQSIKYDCVSLKEQWRELKTLCRDIICNTIKPYNGGWRSDALFEQAEEEKYADF